jgi:flagellar basal-body rod protein FlgC
MAGIVNSLKISAAGLSVQRTRMNTVAQNLANVETTETPEGGPYKRKRVVVSEEGISGGFQSEMQRARTSVARTNHRHLEGKSITVSSRGELDSAEAREITDPESSYRLIYDPTHPQADEEGYVKMPDVDVVTEMVDMMIASRAYEANAAAVQATKKMIGDALDI